MPRGRPPGETLLQDHGSATVPSPSGTVTAVAPKEEDGWGVIRWGDRT
jgi:hypothetical protein